jgi:hypothetical protein
MPTIAQALFSKKHGIELSSLEVMVKMLDRFKNTYMLLGAGVRATNDHATC